MALPNLDRKDLKLFAYDATAENNIAVFGSLAEVNPQFSKDIEEIQSLDAFLQGWSNAITGDASPALEDMNALFYVLFYQMAYLFQKGVAQWKSTTDYYIGSFTTDGNGALYTSVVDNNVGNNPATDDGTHWNKFPTPAEVATKVSKSGDTMSGQLVMANGSNGIRFNSPDTEGGYVGGNASLTDEQKDILYRFFYKYPTSKNDNPLKSGESYRLYQGHYISDPNSKAISIGWINTSNEYCEYTFGGAFKSSTNASNMWWNNPTDFSIASPIDLNMVITQADSPTDYIEPSTDNFYYVKVTGSLSLLNNEDKGLILDGNTNAQPYYFDGTNAYRLLTTNDEQIIINNAFPDFSAGVSIPSGTVLSFHALVIAKGSPGGYSTITLYADGEVIWSGGVSENSPRFRAGGAYCGAGTTITATNANTITAYPMK